MQPWLPRSGGSRSPGAAPLPKYSGNLSGLAASNPNIPDIGESYAPGPTTAHPAPGTGDAELVRRALARDEAAVRAIMQANNRRLYRLARGILRNDSEAEDVVQETYVRAFTHLEQFRGDSQPFDLACRGSR